MKIHGLQKMTLLDYPGKVACTVFLGGCDYRCPFCHNADILDMNKNYIMEDDELLSFLEGRKGLLDGVAVTGGEPLLRPDLNPLLAKIKDMGFMIKVDTNGNHPDHLERLITDGLVDYVAMDVKNSPEKYGEIIGLSGFDTSNVDRSIHILLLDRVEYEFRTTVIKQFHNEDSFEKIGEWIRGAKRYYLQSFVDRDMVPFAGLSACSPDEMKTFREIMKKYVISAELRGVE